LFFSMGVIGAQVRVSVMDYMDCKPHYQWLMLEKRTAKDRPTTGELHIRVQLRSDDQYLRLQGACNVQVSLHGVGVSLVQAQTSSLRPPCELMYCLLEDVSLDFRCTDHEESIRLAIHTLQARPFPHHLAHTHIRRSFSSCTDSLNGCVCFPSAGRQSAPFLAAAGGAVAAHGVLPRGERGGVDVGGGGRRHPASACV
jgi:hypothetical protein